MTGARLNRELVLEAPQKVADGSGGFLESWIELGRIWAEVRARPGREVRLGSSVVARATHQITVRAAPFGAASRPTPTQRFREGPRQFRILSVTEADLSGRHLVCAAVEEIAA